MLWFGLIAGVAIATLIALPAFAGALVMTLSWYIASAAYRFATRSTRRA